MAIQFYQMMKVDGIVCDIVIFNTLINVSKHDMYYTVIFILMHYRFLEELTRFSKLLTFSK